MELREVFLIIILNIVIYRVLCEQATETGEDHDYKEVTVKIVTVETTTQQDIALTDIPQSDVDAALKLDVGDYTTQVFNYINFGFANAKNTELCYQQYMKCVINQGLATPICVVNSPFEIPDGYRTFDSICEFHLDNCRRQRHFWRILDVGKCYHGSELHFNIKLTKRNFGAGRPWQFIFYILGSKDQSAKFNQNISSLKYN